jgi:hypothetical protein
MEWMPDVTVDRSVSRHVYVKCHVDKHRSYTHVRFQYEVHYRQNCYERQLENLQPGIDSVVDFLMGATKTLAPSH